MNAIALLVERPKPSLSAASAAETQTPACGVDWQITVSYTVSPANDANWEIDIDLDTGTGFSSLVTGLSTGSSSYLDDTGETSDGTIVSNESRTYKVKLVPRGGGTAVTSLTTSTISRTMGNPC